MFAIPKDIMHFGKNNVIMLCNNVNDDDGSVPKGRFVGFYANWGRDE